MKAIVYKKRGTFIFCDVENPVPNDNEVLIKIVSASANAADYRLMNMGFIPKKRIFGSGISGKVESVGKDVRQFKPGDEVIGDLIDCGFGGFAEYATATEKALIIKPAKITHEEAATLPLAGTTALQALCSKGNIQKGQKVLIVGSSGGVGTFAVQLAKYFGAVVTAVCSSRNIEQAFSLGADHVIDYTKEDFTGSSIRYDLILSINGNYPLSGYKRILNSKGITFIVGGALTQLFKSILFGWFMSLGSKKVHILMAKSEQKDLEFIAKLLEDGKIKSVIERSYPFNKAGDAIDYLSKGHVQGKVIVNIIEDNNRI